jgi:N-acetylglutamate synthase-like GNAT family acetyltransferase
MFNGRWAIGILTTEVLDCLAVRPDHREHGIATKLVESGLKGADKIGFDTFVVSKNAGLRVYQRAGFTIMER